VPASLEEALDALAADNEFLTEGGVFTKEFIENYINLKRDEAKAVAIRIHPHEYSLYFDC
jgi:glutamine synthetase